MKRIVHYQCAAIVQPGEYTIDRWDGKQCMEDNPRLLVRCEECKKSFCVTHWWKHECAPLPLGPKGGD